MSDTDAYVYDSSALSGEQNLSRFRAIRDFPIPDTNNGSYSAGEIQWNMPSLSTQDAHCCLGESYLQIPYRVTVAADQNISGAENALALKGGFLGLISNFSLRIDNHQVCTRSDLTSVPMTFDLISKSTANDINNVLDELNFALDDTGADYIAHVGEHTPANGGLTLKNGKVVNAADATFAKFSNAARVQAAHRSNVTVAAQLVTYDYLVNIPLRYLNPVFEKLQLCKGLFIELYVNVHSSTSTYLVTKAASAGGGSSATALAEISAVSNQPRFEVTPFVVDPTLISTPFAANGVTATTITITSGISTETTLGLRSCMFHAKLYQMRPQVEAEYASALSSKKIDYPSYHLNVNKNILPNSQSRLQIINSTQKMRYLILHTCIAEAVNGSTAHATPGANAAAVAAYSPLASAFSNSPVTCAPHFSLSSFQVYISGSPMFEQPQSYSHLLFKEHYQASTMMLDGDRSGLIDERKWNDTYGYFIVDLQRMNSIADDLSNRSLEVQFVNNAAYPVDLRAFLALEQSVQVATQTGKVVRA